LRRAAARLAASRSLAEHDLAVLPTPGSLRDPRLAAIEQALRNPSSLPRSLSASSLVARPLHPSVRDTSVRTYNSFERSQIERFHARQGPNYDVSALRVLEGGAAGAHTFIPNQATARPYNEKGYVLTKRPQTVGASMAYSNGLNGTGTRSRQFGSSFGEQPVMSAPLPDDVAVASPDTADSNVDGAVAPFDSTLSNGESAATLVPCDSVESACGSTLASSLPVPSKSGTFSGTATLARNSLTGTGRFGATKRSHSFRPQYTSPHATQNIPANQLLNTTASPARYLRRSAEYQGAQLQELTL